VAGLKDLIRKRAADSTTAKMDVLEVDFGDGERMKVGVLHPTMKQRRKFAEIGATGRKKDGGIDFAAATAMKHQSVIDCAVDVETREQIWTREDQEILESSPAGGWVDKISDRVMQLGRGAASACECGEDLALDAKFCKACGAAVPTAGETAEKNSSATRSGT